MLASWTDYSICSSQEKTFLIAQEKKKMGVGMAGKRSSLIQLAIKEFLEAMNLFFGKSTEYREIFQSKNPQTCL